MIRTSSGPIQSGMLLTLLTCLAPAGCGPQRLKTYPVEGRVVFSDGSPVHTGSVEFRSRNHDVRAHGSIDRDGNFRLTTYRPEDGAVAGEHDCVVVQVLNAQRLGPTFRPSLLGIIDPRYSQYRTSPLECTIERDKTNRVRLTVEPLQTSLSDATRATRHQHGLATEPYSPPAVQSQAPADGD
jgi:hypothetical protein